MTETLSDKLWSGYAAYVLAHCPKVPREVDGSGYYLDDMAEELLALAMNWDVHQTF